MKMLLFFNVHNGDPYFCSCHKTVKFYIQSRTEKRKGANIGHEGFQEKCHLYTIGQTNYTPNLQLYTGCGWWRETGRMGYCACKWKKTHRERLV